MINPTPQQGSIDLIELQERLSVVEDELAAIRNHRVESNEAWETIRARL
jgi:hypothetical protein